MNYVGIDIHKRYSVLCAQDEAGQKLKEARIEGHERRDYARFFKDLEGPSRAVLEACWNWGLTHDLLEEIGEVEEVVLAHPLKTRLIADAQIKTDRLDAFALGYPSARESGGAGLHSAARDPGAQEPAAPTALLVAPAHHAAQSHPCLA